MSNLYLVRNCLAISGIVAIPVNTNHDESKEGAIKATSQRNEHAQGTATHKSGVNQVRQGVN